MRIKQNVFRLRIKNSTRGVKEFKSMIDEQGKHKVANFKAIFSHLSAKKAINLLSFEYSDGL